MQSNLRESAHAMLQEGKASISIYPIYSADDLYDHSMSIEESPNQPCDVRYTVELGIFPAEEFEEEWCSRVWDGGVAMKEFELFTDALAAATEMVNLSWDEIEHQY